MAKVHSLAVRKARGQMGGMVYSTYGGQTIVREKPAVVSNPRTNSQMNQRIKMANVVGLYKPNRAWMEKWAFPERPQKWSNYNAYMSENLAKSVISLTKVECELGAAVLEPLTFTKGTLPIIPCTFNRISGWITDILLHNVFDPSWTVAEFTTNLLYSSRGWQEGDQLSIILMQQYMRTVAYTPNISSGAPVPIIKPVVETKAFEVTLDSTNTTDHMEDFGFDEVFSAERALIIAPNALCLDTDAVAHGILFVHSRKGDGGITVSTQALILDDYTIFNQYASVEQRRQARASYNATSDAFLVPNAPQGGGGVSPTPPPVSLTDFDWPISCADLGGAVITLTNGMSGEAGLLYLSQHLVFSTDGDPVTIYNQGGETENVYILKQGDNSFNTISTTAQPGVYELGGVSSGPTLTAALWDGEQFNPAV